MTMWDVALYELAEIERMKEKRRKHHVGTDEHRKLNREIVRRSRHLEECMKWLMQAEEEE